MRNIKKKSPRREAGALIEVLMMADNSAAIIELYGNAKDSHVS